MTFLTSKRPSTSSTRQESWNFWFFWIFWTCEVVGRRPARGIAGRISRLDCWEFLKLYQWQITSKWGLNLHIVEHWYLGTFRFPVYYLLEHSLSQFQMWTFHFALNSTFTSGFRYGMKHTNASLVCASSVLHTEKATSCSSQQYRDDFVRDVKGSSRLSRRFLRQNQGRQRSLQVVVREQLGPQLGKQAIMESIFLGDL